MITPKWIHDAAIGILTTLGSGMLLSGIWLFYNVETKASVEDKMDKQKQEISADFRREDDEIKRNFTRQVELLNQSLNRMVMIMEQQNRGNK